MAETAERVVVELIARTEQLDSKVAQSATAFSRGMQTIEQSAGTAERSVSRAALEVVRSTGQIQQSQRNLGFQIADTFAQLAGGQSPFLILAQQGPQAANALEGASGAVGRLAGFLSGPFGAAALGAVTVLGVLVSKSFEAANAKDSHRKATDDLKAAIDRLNAAAESENHTTRIGIQLDIDKANSARARAVATLQANKADLIKARDAFTSGEDFNASAGASIYARQVQAQIDQSTKDIEALSKNVRVGQVKLADRDVAGATDKATAATQRYEDALSRLRRQQEAGKLVGGDAEYRRQALALIRTRDAALESAKALGRHSSASTASADAEARLSAASGDVAKAQAQLSVTRAEARKELKAGSISLEQYQTRVAAAERAVTSAKDAHKSHAEELRKGRVAANETEAAIKALQSAFESLQDRYDPAAAAARRYREELELIAKLEGPKSKTNPNPIDKATAETFRKGANDRFVKANADAFNMPDIEAYRADERDLWKDRKDAEDRFKRQREDSLRELSGLYEDLFTGGTRAILDDFKRMFLRALSDELAKQTLGLFESLRSGGKGGGGGSSLVAGEGNIFSKISQSIWGIFGGGRASGGPVSAGKTYLVGERGPEILQMGGSSGTVIPNHALGRAASPGGGVTNVYQSFTLDARFGITTPDLLQHVNDIATQKAAQAGRASYSAAVEAAPGRLRQQSTLGT